MQNSNLCPWRYPIRRRHSLIDLLNVTRHDTTYVCPCNWRSLMADLAHAGLRESGESVKSLNLRHVDLGWHFDG